ncbi:SDR family oxidoreductase [Streptomyces sp. NPDC088353]|uniref:SDR family oxidoreductase n=1 Tax=Streptomyces sp. NPDC088353 TaxID=3365855 RepID=UPI00382CC38D
MRCSCQDDGHPAVCYEQRPYAPQSAYGPSKTANTIFAVETARCWAGDGITVNAVMPGVIRTNLMRHVDPALLARNADSDAPAPHWKTAEQGAATFVLLAVSPHTECVTGQYFEDCQEANGRRAQDVCG